MKLISILLFSLLPASLHFQIYSNQVRLQLSPFNLQPDSYRVSTLLHEQDTLYINLENKPIAKKKNAHHFKVTTQTDSGYVVEFLDKNEVLYQKITFNDPQLKTRHGYSADYNGESTLSEGRYKNGEQDGIWKYYHSDGLVSAIVNYSKGKKISEEYFTIDRSKEHDLKKIERLPSFPGGQQAMGAFYSRVLRYPPEARERGARGTVKIGFNISTNGELQDIRVISGPDEDLNKEALRVIKMMPRWIPAIQFNRPVKFAYVLPIFFQLG